MGGLTSLATVFFVILLATHLALCTFVAPKLQKGDTIGFVSPAYSVLSNGQKWTQAAFIDHVVEGFTTLGYKVNTYFMLTAFVWEKLELDVGIGLTSLSLPFFI